MVTLPFPPHPISLVSFWLAISLLGGILLGMLGVVLDVPFGFLWGPMLALVLALPGVLWPEHVFLPYRLWNRLAILFARGARLWLLGICFYLILAAVNRSGSRLRLERPADSGWVTRQPHVWSAYGSMQGVSMQAALPRHWLLTFLAWVRQTGHWWTLGLLPFVGLLALFDHEEAASPAPGSLYTLF